MNMVILDLDLWSQNHKANDQMETPNRQFVSISTGENEGVKKK